MSFATAVLAPFRDVWLAGRARVAVLVEAGREASEVTVEAFHGSVVLIGNVTTHDNRDRIERAVRRLADVVGVDNRLRVLGEQRGRSRGGDAETKLLVAAALRRAPFLRACTIHLRSVYDGVVTLTGTVQRQEVAAATFDLVINLPGVRRVICDIATLHHVDAGRNAAAA
ncbi:MAG: BON domain-containing protein [Candidatus Binatia bacterium]